MGKYLDGEGCLETLKTEVRGSPCREAVVMSAVLLSLTIERKLKRVLLGTSLVVQGLSACLAMQGMWV